MTTFLKVVGWIVAIISAVNLGASVAHALASGETAIGAMGIQINLATLTPALACVGIAMILERLPARTVD